MTELEKYITGSFHVQALEAAIIARKFQPVLLAKGQSFLKQGRLSDRVGFMESGLLRQFKDIEGREITQWISGSGNFVADLGSLVFDAPSRYTFEALTDVELHVIHKSDFDAISVEIANWPDLQKSFLAKCFMVMEERLLQHLSMSAEERYQALFLRDKSLFNTVPLNYLASMMGMTPETLSRIRRKAP